MGNAQGGPAKLGGEKRIVEDKSWDQYFFHIYISPKVKTCREKAP